MYTVSESLYNDAIELARSIVVKRKDLADKNETVESAKRFERYERLLEGYNRLSDYDKLDEDIMLQVVGDPEAVKVYVEHPDWIPQNFLTEILQLHMERYYTNYTELNNYYRSLYGLPDLDDTGLIYVTNVVGVRPTIPVHQLTNSELIIIQINGVLADLIKKHPDKTYIKHLGPNKIDFYVARKAQNLDIIRIDEPRNSKAKQIFMREYYLSRKFHVTTMYDPDLFRRNDIYNGVMGFLILTSAIRNMVSTNHLFLDNEELLNDTLRSYGLYEYFANLPITHKRKLVDNLDTLLMYSGSDRVLIEISNIFGFDSTINRYHMLKRHNKDVEGNLIFPKNLDGSYNYDEMYRLDFLKVNVNDDRINIIPENILDFNSVVEKDPLWQITPEYMSKIKQEQFNVTLSKYVSLESAYDVSQLVYEMSYFLNLLIDSRKFTSGIRAVNMYSRLNYSDLFTYIMFLFAAISKRNEFDGNINYAPADVALLLKFNLDDITTTFNQINKKYNLKLNVSNWLLQKPSNIMNNPDELVQMYQRNSSIYSALLKLMNDTNDVKKFTGYEQIRKLLFVSNNIQNVFRLKNGNVAQTYGELLADLDQSLYDSLDALEENEQLDNMIEYVLEKLQFIFKDANLSFLFLNTPDMQDRILKIYFTRMVNLFIASTTDLAAFDIIFKVNGTNNIIRTFDRAYPAIQDVYRKDITVTNCRVKTTRKVRIVDSASTSDNMRTI